MINFQEIPRKWPNSVIYVIGGGPSLNDMDLSLIHDAHILGVNQAFTLGDWVDVNFSGDQRWYQWNRQKLKNYKGLSISCYPNFIPDRFNPNSIGVRRLSHDGICSASSGCICWNGNSGAAAVNVAYHLGAIRIVLLGFDMKMQGQKYNWHEDHKIYPDRKTNGRMISPYRQFLKCWDPIARDAKKLGIEILNATPSGNLNHFKRVKLEEVL